MVLFSLFKKLISKFYWKASNNEEEPSIYGFINFPLLWHMSDVYVSVWEVDTHTNVHYMSIFIYTVSI